MAKSRSPPPALEPARAMAEAHAHFRAGRLDQAEALASAGIARHARRADALQLLGVIALGRGRPQVAVDRLGRAIAAAPGSAATYGFLGAALRMLGKIDDAIAAWRKAIALKPDQPVVIEHLGAALGAQGKFEESVAVFQRLVALTPKSPQSFANLGEALRRLGRMDDAVAALRHAIALGPAFPMSHASLAVVLRAQGKIAEAIAASRQAIALKPDFAEAHVNLAAQLLLIGDFAAGWEEYEWRWRNLHASQFTPRGYRQKRWSDEAVGERIVLLHAEQGLGDTLQFCRYVPLVAKQAQVVLEVPRPLMRLLSSLKGGIRIVAPDAKPPPFDVYCPLMSLPWIFGTTLATIPAETPYLAPDATQAATWRETLAGLAGLRVGLAWAANVDAAEDATVTLDRRARSIALADLAALGAVPGVSFVSLQKGEAAAQTRSPPPGLVVYDWTDALDDFADTAALVAALDLVISVDTSVAHVAGALGKPVWLLTGFSANWRWLQEREDSPWYPAMRLFRQTAPGDWPGVIERVATALAARAAVAER